MLDFLLDPVILAPFMEFARGGGGGSGGGGSGGGGSIIALIGYVPAYFVTSRAYKHTSAFAAYALGGVTAIAVTAGMSFFGGGIGFLVFIGAAVGVYTGTHNLLSRLAKKIKLTRKTVAEAAQTDPAWDMQYLDAQVQGTFPKFQRDWTVSDLQSISSYTSTAYYQHVELLLRALHDLGRQNVVANARIKEWYIVEAHNNTSDDLDAFTAYISAAADDTLISQEDGRQIYTDTSAFEEFWRFDREGDRWVLDSIKQATENPQLTEVNLRKFAENNGMFYSPDMGYLLLPERGQLFGKANFTKSDINNHVIGQWQGLLVQLYTYIPHKSRQRADNYLVGQIALPKTYGGIIIKRRANSWFNLDSPGREYQRVSFEWPDFNKRFSVYATDMDRVTSFELLNPAFMAELYDMDLPISIEVVDNVVYFHCRTTVSSEHYENMLKVLQRSYRELKR